MAEKLEAPDVPEPAEERTKQTEEIPADGGNIEEKDDKGSDVAKEQSKDAVRRERLKKLQELHLRRNEARKLNHQEVAEEDRRKKLPSNFEAKQRRLEWELSEAKARKEAEDNGENYDRVKLLEASADDLEKFERKRSRKQNPDTGFADFQQAQYRQYQRLTRQLKPSMEEYEKQKRELGDSVYATANTLLPEDSSKPSEAAIDRMVDDLEKQAAKRAKYSRRREFRQDSDVDYINERNRKFNVKAGRFYDKYTSEIKQNLERGTAI